MRSLAPLLLVVAACGSDSRTGEAIDADVGSRPDGRPLAAPPSGRISVLHEGFSGLGQDHAAATAELGMGGLYPSDAALGHYQVVAEEGDCKLLEQVIIQCPPCEANWLCVGPDSCVYGYSLDAGELAFDGLMASPRLAWPFYQSNDLPLPPFLPGATVTARATGGPELPAFEVSAIAPAPLDVEVPPTGVILRDDVPTELSWTASLQPGARYRFQFGSPHGHGGRSVQRLVCEGPDVGRLTIAPAVVAGLQTITDGCIGLTCELGGLARYHSGTTSVLDGGITLELVERLWFKTLHPPP